MSAKHEFKQGDTVYSIDGHRATYVTPVMTGHVVVPEYEGDEFVDESYTGDAVTWHRVFRAAPVPSLDKAIAVQQAELARVKDLVAKARAEQAELAQGDVDRKKRLAEHRGLRQLDDYLAGRITHFVYDDASIKTFDEALQRTNEWREKSVRLLALYGDASRVPRWGISAYCDGSGSKDAVIPCLSEDEAKDTARQVLADGWAKHRAAKDCAWGLASAIARAEALGAPIPDDIQAQAKAMARASAETMLPMRRKQLADAQAALAEAESEARAAGLATGASHG